MLDLNRRETAIQSERENQNRFRGKRAGKIPFLRTPLLGSQRRKISFRSILSNMTSLYMFSRFKFCVLLELLFLGEFCIAFNPYKKYAILFIRVSFCFGTYCNLSKTIFKIFCRIFFRYFIWIGYHVFALITTWLKNNTTIACV